MARNDVANAALIVTLVVAATAAVVAEAAERNGNSHCMAECYFDCSQIKIFSDEECKKECVFACVKNGVGRNSRKDYDAEFFPAWI